MYHYNAKILNIVDGDTFDLDVDLGFNIHHYIRCRLLDIDTPEKKGSEYELGMICKEYAEKYFLGKSITIRSYKESEDIHDIYSDSFGRYLAYCELDDGTSISEIYNVLGINKCHESYSPENVLKLKLYADVTQLAE